MFCNVNLNNLENVFQKNLRADKTRECVSTAIGGTILKIHQLDGNHGGASVDSIYVPVCPKIWDTSLVYNKN